MSCTVNFLLDPKDNRVTKVVIRGDKFLVDEVSRLSGSEVVPGEKEGDFFLRNKTFLNIPEDHDFFVDALGDSVDVSIETDETLLNFSHLIKMLERLRLENIPENDVEKISTLIDYAFEEKWNRSCDSCGKIIPLKELFRNLSILCQDCISKSD